MTGPWTQDGHQVRFDWGTAGADAVCGGSTIVAVVDVLSFTTTVTVAVAHGIAVRPYRWGDASAADVARHHDAVLAVGRSQATDPGQLSLSPATVAGSSGVRRLVLPSPNGATVADRLAGRDATVIGVCLRNARAAAAWTRRRLRDQPDAVVAVIGAGERWPDGSLRPAAEDLWGAGAYLSHLAGHGTGHRTGSMSPEAQTATAAYAHAVGRLPDLLRDCASGRELIRNGHPEDVAIATECDVSAVVPVLTDGWFVDGAAPPIQ